MDETEEMDDFMTNPNHLLRQELAAMHHDWTPESSPSMSPHEIHGSLHDAVEQFSPELYDELNFLPKARMRRNLRILSMLRSFSIEI